MRTAGLALSILIALTLHPASAQQAGKPERAVIQRIHETKLKRNAFSGNESRFSAMNLVNADCTGGPRPDVRVVTPPSQGELRLEDIDYAVSRESKDSRAHCNGKIVPAVGVFYRSKQEFVGSDKAVLDVDFRNGTVRRFTYDISVR